MRRLSLESFYVSSSLSSQDKLVGLVLYEGMLKCIPVDAKGLFGDAFNVRLPDREIVSMCFVSNAPQPVLAYLCRDGEQMQLRSFVVNVRDKSLGADGGVGGAVDRGASHLLPLARGGVLVAGELEVAWLGGKAPVVARFPGEQRSRLTAAGKVDADGARWLLGDESGRLWLLAVAGAATGVVTRLTLEELGTTVAASAISYLDNGVVFIGSALGDSQVLRLLAERDAETGALFEVLEAQANLAPIVDFACVDLESQGQDQVVACCGAHKDGTLRVIRNGVGVIVEADLPLPNITGVWSMRASSSATHDKYLGVSFASQTVFLAMEEDDDLSELSASGGLAADVRTLFCGTTVSDLLLQVHAGAVHLVQASSLAMCDRWQPPEGTQITVCCAAASQVRSLLIFSVSHVSFSRVRWSLRLAERRLCTCELPE
jgi:DNA damage-binding protein 1